MDNSNLRELGALEHPTLKVPYEVFNKRYRLSQKIIDKEQHAVSSAVDEVEKCLNSTSSENLPNMVALLDTVMEKLKALKRKAGESIDEDVNAARVCKMRVDHLRTIESNPIQFEKKRIDRLLVEHCFRCGHYETASLLAKRADVEEFTNLELFTTARDIEASLASRKTDLALAWCAENRSRLKKTGSFLEFHLRQQEVIELIKKGRGGCMDAILHARKHFIQLEDYKLYEKDIQKTMILLAVLPKNISEKNNPYHDLLSDVRWTWLIEEFRKEILRMYQLSPESVFAVTLQAGLASLKTPACMSDTERKNPDCPVCNENLNVIATSLPFAHCSQSRLVCYISGEPMNETNRPMMLPNGYVYGEKSLMLMATNNNDVLTCPRTGSVYKLADAQRVYVM
ncbi:E3 ubiquitin-protein transferase MAEA-like [Paramacrobiotus metropolitanus]|uniref:E3 ubiquitin-protein transferase MAEA-like n=1 Tax=Paramacrobiotus metropolitanus TaxID=2943436 RepID=UPI0024462D4A|nr:E3 ubiquitin-protein transferase MAEA-like [Paramacrobiotus metropolitanus]XP_055337702.1 E3 ubiquitin-protein transferase MAEA-like [Paramacrobiotus metropolitanus]